jgi:hypothetical protein
MTREEAVELVLGGGAWVPCAPCGGGGYVNENPGKRLVKCRACQTAGYLPEPALEAAYALLEVPYPDKPATSVEAMLKARIGEELSPGRQALAQAGGQYIRDQLRETSMLRRLMPPEQIPKKP